MRRLVRSRLIWIYTVCKCVSELTWCPNLPDFTLAIEVSLICRYITNQVVHVQSMLFLNISHDISSRGLNFWTKFATICLLCLCMSLNFPANRPSYFRGYQWNWANRATNVWWNVHIRWIVDNWYSEVEVILFQSRIWMNMEIFFFCKSERTFFHRFIITFLVLVNYPLMSLIGEQQLSEFQQ